MTGMCVMFAPVAFAMALAIAGAVPSSGSSPIPFAPGGSARVGNFFEENADRRNVHGRGHDVVGHLAVAHAAFLPDYIFIECEADTLCDAAFDLACGENGIDDLADFLDGDEVFNANLGGARLDGNFGDIDSPGVCAVGIALVAGVVPVEISRMFDI